MTLGWIENLLSVWATLIGNSIISVREIRENLLDSFTFAHKTPSPFSIHCKGVLSVANCRLEVTNYPLAVWVNYIVTVMCDVAIIDEI